VTTPTFVAKRFLQGAAGDLVNADYIVRLFVDGAGKLNAEMAGGANIELATSQPITSPTALPALPVKLVNL
jgi:hypothetical protein